MKKTLLFLFILFYINSYSQISESFTSGLPGSYTSGTVTLSSGDWEVKNVYPESASNSYGGTGKAARLNDDKSESSITTPAINGVGTISFFYRELSSGGGTMVVQTSTDGTNFSTIEEQVYSGTTYSEYSYSLNQSGTVYIKVAIFDEPGHLIVDEFSTTAFVGVASPGITLSATSGSTAESGSTTSFTVELDAAPTSDVVLDVTSSDETENTVSPSSLTFTNANWDTPQTVTVTGVDDQVSDGDIVSIVTISVDYANSDDDYDSVSDKTFSVINVDDDVVQLIISEIMYNSLNGFSDDDEWIEIYNNNGSTVDISNYNLTTGNSSVDFTFPSGSSINDGQYITLAIGSNGDGVFNISNPFTPDYNAGVKSSGSLVTASQVADTDDTNHLTNSGGTITLVNSNSTTIDTVDYDDGDASTTDGDGPSYEVINLSSDNTDTDTNWQASANTGGSPGVVNSQSGDSDSTPIETLTISSSGNVTITSDLSVTDLTIDSSGSLTIEEGKGVTVSNDLVINGSLTLNSISNEFASLIVSGTVTGEITYSRYVNIEGSGEWDLIGPPVDGLDMTTFINDNSSLATNPTNADLYAIGSYDNSTDEWTNYTLATANGNNVELGVGYQMATDSGTTLDFTGDVAITDQTTSIINNDGNGSGRRWNLVANPYPSYLNINSDAHATDNFLTINLANGNLNIDAEFSAVYGWNADGTGYSSYDNNDTAKYIAPGQGFFVAASGSVDLDFTTAMRTVSGGDDFIVGDAVEFPEVYLNLYNGDMVMGQTHVRFRDNMTLGLNPSYDVGSYNQNAAITTRLVEEDQGTNFEHQNLPINAIQNVTIPLVINQAAGQEFKVNLHTSTIYDSNVYLEDAEEGTFTNLYEGDFAMTPTSDLSGAGRFFIHITANTMSNEDVSTSMLNAYKEVNNNYITIEGLATQSNNINVSLYNILGRKVLDTSLSNNMNTQTISTLGMASGIYVIELESGSDRLTKKLIIQ